MAMTRSKFTPPAYALVLLLRVPLLHRMIRTDQIQFKAMSFAMVEEEHKQPTKYKLVCVGPEEKVVGLHIIGEGSDEIMQGCKSAMLVCQAKVI